MHPCLADVFKTVVWNWRGVGAVFNSRIRRWFEGFPLTAFPPNQLCPLALCQSRLVIYSVKQIHAKVLCYTLLRIYGILATAIRSTDQSILNFR